MIYSNGEVYSGEWAEGKKNGHGVMLCVDDTRRVGEWKEGNLIHHYK